MQRINLLFNFINFELYVLLILLIIVFNGILNNNILSNYDYKDSIYTYVNIIRIYIICCYNNIVYAAIFV